MYSGVKNIIRFFVSLWICNISIAQNSRPNILLILVDDLRYDALSATGHPFFESPSIDRIANEGVKFSNSFIVTSLCVPSRTSILTGLYTFQHQVYNNQFHLNDSIETLGSILQENGYHTGLIGKWHVTRNASPKPGYDRWVSFKLQGRYIDPILNVDGDTVQVEGYITEILTDYALDYITKSSTRTEPFFLYLSHKAVHKPMTPSDHNAGFFDGVQIEFPETWYEDLSTKPEFVSCRNVTTLGSTDGMNSEFEKVVRSYFETLLSVEESTERIMNLLDSLGITDDTFILFTSDNGFHLGEHNLQGKRIAYEESIRMPLFCRYPAWFSPGTEPNNEIALNIDIPRTILELAGVNSFGEMKGKSLHKLANGEEHRNEFLYEHYKEYVQTFIPAPYCTPSIKSIRTNRFKYSTFPETDELEELYDLRSDPLEEVNLYFNPSYDNVRDILRCKLDSIRFALGDTLRGIAEVHIPHMQAVLGDTVDIPVQVEFPEDSLIDRFTMSISGFSGQLEFIKVHCFNSCLLQDSTWVTEVTDTNRLRISGWTDDGGITGEGILFWIRSFIPETSATDTILITIESAKFNNGEFPVCKQNGSIHAVEFMGVQIPYGEDWNMVGLRYTLYQNYPNPFNPVTTITFDIPELMHVHLAVYDLDGREVKMILDDYRKAGSHSVMWNGKDKDGTLVSSGLYFIQLETENFIQTKKTVIIR